MGGDVFFIPWGALARVAQTRVAQKSGHRFFDQATRQIAAVAQESGHRFFDQATRQIGAVAQKSGHRFFDQATRQI